MAYELLLPIAAVAAASPNEIRYTLKYHMQRTGLDEDLSEAFAEGKADILETPTKRGKAAKIAALSAFAIAVGFEWGPGNETLLSYVAGQNLIDSGSNLAPLIVGLKTGAVSFLEQVTCGLTGIAAIHSVPRFMKKIRETKEIHSPTNSSSEDNLTELEERQSRWTRLRKRANLSFVTGANLFLLKEHATRDDLTKKDELKSIATSGAAVGTYIAGMGAVVGLAHFAGEDFAEKVGTYITPAVLGVIALGTAVSYFSKKTNVNELDTETSSLPE